MVVQVDEKQRFMVNWNAPELQGIGSALLVFHAEQTFGRACAADYHQKVYSTPMVQWSKLDRTLPAGLYSYYLADCGTGKALIGAEEIFLGQAVEVPVTLERMPGERQFCRLTLRSPFALRSGDVQLNYGGVVRIPLPDSVREGEKYLVRCVVHVPHGIVLNLECAPKLEKIVRLSGSTLNERIRS